MAVTSLAIAIGFHTAIFSESTASSCARAPLADVDRLVMVWETDRNTGTTREPAWVREP